MGEKIAQSKEINVHSFASQRIQNQNIIQLNGCIVRFIWMVFVKNLRQIDCF